MRLELLCDELLLYLFEFLNDVHLFRAFYGLNYRFDTLLFDYSRSYCLDFRSIPKRDFQTICEKYAPSIVDRVTSICFSDDDDTPQQIKYYLDHSMPLRLFSNLRSLSLCHLRSYKTMEEISEEWRHLPHLTQLCLIQCHMESHTSSCQTLLNSIWCLPKLIRCHFGVSFPGNDPFPVPTVTSISLTHLSVQHLNCRFSELLQLIEHTPHIRHLRISINMYSVSSDLSLAIPSIISLILHVRDAPLAMSKLLKYMPNLKHLTVKSLDTYLGFLKNFLHHAFQEDATYQNNFHKKSVPIYMDGCKWEEIIVNHLPKLKTFQLKMDIQYWSPHSKEDEVKKLLASFRSHFWIRERRLFVRCDWNPNPDSSYVCLYTLPYAFDDFNTHTASIRFKSTSTKTDYWLYNRVRNLHYHYSLSDSSALNRARFSNIRHLSIELPFNESIPSALSTFDHMNSLTVFILNDDVKAHNQLQTLLDRAPTLYSLRLSCGKLLAPELALLTNSSASVHCLDLDGYTQHKDWHWFTSQQCVALCNSPLGIQCEVLRMKVENPMDVLELVYSMPYLRALNVQILNDERNIPDFESSSTNDELVHWLRHSLDSTCTIVRHESDSHYIQLWIR